MRLWLGAVTLLATVACAGAESDTRTLVVSAASSLSDVFSIIETRFESTHPDVEVILNTGGSSLLREQIIGGAPVDVFASANPEIMDEVVDAGMLNGEPSVFAFNEMQIGVPRGNPSQIQGLEDFARQSLLLGLCAPTVPCGVFARQILDSAGIEASVDSEEPNVRALLLKLESGELDAGIVYKSDILASSEVEGIPIPEKLNISASYVIGVIDAATDLEAATDFVSFVRSNAGRQILVDHGFEVP